VCHFLFLIVFFSQLIWPMDLPVVLPVEKHCYVNPSDQHYQQILQQFLPDQFWVEKVEYQVDGDFDGAELEYLTGLQALSNYSQKDLVSALFYLQQSQKFATINLQIHRTVTGFELIFQLTKNQILQRVVVSGFLRGKESLKNNYLIDVGESFDQQKHLHSLDQMVNFLKDRGYFQAKISEQIIVDRQTQGVVVNVVVSKGHKFKINKVAVVFDHVGSVPPDEIEALKFKLESVCKKKLEGKRYILSVVQQITQKIKLNLDRDGCIDFSLEVVNNLDNARNSIDLDFRISLERKKEIVFWGASFFTREQILDHLLLYGKSTWHFPSSLIVDEIEQLYKSKGFWNVAVSVREEQGHVFCFIEEGSRAIISDVVFKNDDNVTNLKSIKNSVLSFLRVKYFDKDRCKKMLDRVLKSYKQAGFWDVKIIKEEFVPLSNASSYQLCLTFDQGCKRVLGQISIPDYLQLEKQLKLIACHSVGLGFDSALLLQHKQWLTRTLHNQGYQKVNVEYSLQDHQGVVDVVWRIKLGESVAKLGKTIILGNSKVAHRHLMQAVEHEQGQVWDKRDIEATLKNFRELLVFDSVQVYPGTVVDPELCKPVFVKLVEADRYEIRTRFGLQQVGRNLQFRRGFTYKVGTTLCIKNPFVCADQFLFVGDMTRFYRNIAATYQAPWAFGKKINIQLKVYDTQYKQPVFIGCQDSLYRAAQQGFLCNMSHSKSVQKSGKLIFSGSTGVEFLGLYQADQKDLNLIIDYDRLLLEKKIGYLFVEPMLLWQKMDNLLNPHVGFMSLFSCKGMFDFDSKTSFFKVTVEHSQYLPLAPRLTLALRARLGHVFNRYFNQINPIERFYLGGACSLRGYDPDYCPPYGLLTEPIYDQHAGLPACANNLWRYAPQGGRSMFNFNAEFRIGVYHNFGIAIFNDVGALFKHSIYDELKSWRDNFFAGSGIGIRYDTPIGPLRFDVGCKWKKNYPDFQPRSVWYLTLGQAF
jgi:outer membrane protein assembly factor BamA